MPNGGYCFLLADHKYGRPWMVYWTTSVLLVLYRERLRADMWLRSQILLAIGAGEGERWSIDVLMEATETGVEEELIDV